LATPISLKQKHIQALANHWKSKKLSAKTIQGLFSNLREFSRWINKPGLVMNIESYFDNDQAHLVRKTVAQNDLSWESRGIDLSVIFAEARELDPRFEVLLRLMRNFGLRVKEAIELRPALATALDDEHLLVSHGTKGGKQRIVKIRNDLQRQTLMDAKKLLATQNNMRLRWPDKTWKQAQSHFYHLMRRLSATRKSLKISAHGLRHAFLQDEYKFYAGVPAPIKGDASLPKNKQEHQRAMLAVSLEAGHYRPSITTGYCGSFGHKLRRLENPESKDSDNNHDDDKE
jgi:site-specific recombinase XerD